MLIAIGVCFRSDPAQLAILPHHAQLHVNRIGVTHGRADRPHHIRTIRGVNRGQQHVARQRRPRVESEDAARVFARPDFIGCSIPTPKSQSPH